MTRKNLALIEAAKLCFAVLALFVAQSTHAQRARVASGKDIFSLPVDYNLGTSCDGRLKFRGDPNFLGGLVARYVFLPQKDGSPAQAMHDLADKWVTFSRIELDGNIYTVVNDSNVIKTHDDLLKRFYEICFYANSGFRLVRIDYFRATSGEKHRSPKQELKQDEILPVDVGVADYSFLPTPVANGVLEFPDWPAIFSGKDWIKATPTFSNGLNAAFAFEGDLSSSSDDRGLIEYLMQQGLIAIKVNLNGKTAIVIIDPMVIFTRQMMETRANIVQKLDDAGSGGGMRLQKIVYYPAKNRGPDDLRLAPGVLEEIRAQLLDIRQVRDKRLKALAERLPDYQEVLEILGREWHHYSNDPSQPGYDAELSEIGSTFGELHDMKCERGGDIFSCMVGVTFLQDSHPKYDQREVTFKRDAANGYKLISNPPPDILLIN